MQIWMSGQRRNENVLLDKKRIFLLSKAVELVGWRRLFPLHSKWFLSFVFSCFLSFFAQELEWESQDITSDLLDQKLKALSAEECRSVTKYGEGWFCFLKTSSFQVVSLQQPDLGDA